MRMLRWIIAIAVSLSLPAATGARAASLESIGSFDQPIYVTSDPGNAGRLFVVEREGEIVLMQGGARSVFADLRSVVKCPSSCMGETERGLLSIAPAPDFDATGRLYVDYAAGDTGEIHVAELAASGPNHESAGLGTLRSLLTITHSDAANHNGGQLQFGPEGDLFVSTGDGGGSNDQYENAQNLETGLGKILRIRPNPEGASPFYTVPSDNPFAASATDYKPIWSFGLRNPFRFSFDRANGDLWIGDVGQDTREEVDHAAAPGLGGGANYGWNCREGRLVETVPPEEGCAGATNFIGPVFDYPHANPGGGGAYGCAIIGGYVARDASLASLYGRYVYGDLCTGEIRSFDPAAPYETDRATGLQVENLNSFGEDSCGRLYAVSGDGEVGRFVGATPTDCSTRQEGGTPSPGFLYVGIQAQRRHVSRGKTAVLTVWVTPCAGRKGEPVRLLRNGHRNGSHFLSRACTARFLRRVHRNTTFAATLADPENGTDLAASRKLKIRIARHR
jgi:glucose/arabinose dehydrogenase